MEFKVLLKVVLFNICPRARTVLFLRRAVEVGVKAALARWFLQLVVL